MAYFHCCGTCPPYLDTNDDTVESLSQGEIIVEDSLEQLNGDSVLSNNRSVHQRADGVCRFLPCGLNV